MNLLDFSKLHSLPLSASTLKFMQEMMLQIMALSSLGGINYVLSGCTVTGSNVSDGVVVVNGEVLPFKGGTAGTYVVIVDTPTNRNFGDGTINPYYHVRYATFGTNTNPALQYAWADFEHNDASNALIKRMRLAEGNITTAQTAITGINTTLATKADKSNVLEKTNTTAFTPSANYHPATKAYVDGAQGAKLFFAGSMDLPSVVITKDFPSTALTITVARTDSGVYRISHNLNSNGYFITAMGKSSWTISPRSIVKAVDYFDIVISDDETTNDASFYFQIWTY